MTPDDDPGWPSSISVLVLLVPGAMQWYLRRNRSRDYAAAALSLVRY